jgi:hypothetical protein
MAMCVVAPVIFFVPVYFLVHNCTENRTKGFIGGLNFVLVRSILFDAGTTAIIMVADDSVRTLYNVTCFANLVALPLCFAVPHQPTQINTSVRVMYLAKHDTTTTVQNSSNIVIWFFFSLLVFATTCIP